MRPPTSLALALALAGCAAAPREDEPVAPTDVAVLGRQLNFLAGVREFEDAGFGRIDSPGVIGIGFCEPMGARQMRLEGGLQYTFDEADGLSGGQPVRLKGQTCEVSAGLHYSFLVTRLQPYLGFGASLLFLNLRGIDEDAGTVFDDDDVTGGGYAKAGLLFQVSRTSHVGVEYRHFEGGEASLDGTDLSTNYDQFVLVFGTSFP
jgi:hypothetical protein